MHFLMLKQTIFRCPEVGITYLCLDMTNEYIYTRYTEKKIR